MPLSESPANAGQELPADARDVEELLAGLSQLRLAISAELSAAAGALDDHRPDIAADLVGGARADLQRLRASVARQRARELIPVLVGSEPTAAAGDASKPVVPAGVMATVVRPRREVKLGNWQGRVLAGALALGLALVALPHSGGASGGASNAAQGGVTKAQAIDVKLVSAEFSTLRSTLQSKTPAPGLVLAAGQSWHTAVARTLPTASTNAGTATQIVALLREERALLATPAMGTSAMRQAALQLQDSADGLLARLRSLASPKVLALLPTAITALPLPTTSPTAEPSPSSSPPTVTTPTTTPTAPPTGTGTTVPVSPTAPATPVPTSSAPSTPTPTATPTPATTPVPLPSLIQNLGGGLLGPQDTTGNQAPASSPATAVSPAAPAPSPSASS